VVAVAVCAIAGDAVGYVVGGRLGARLLAEQQPRPRIRRHAVTATAFFERHGPRAVVLARFLPLVRTFTPVVAGAVHMPRARFTAFNVLGASLWSGLILSVGYALGGVPFVANHVELLTVTVVAVTLLPAALTLARRRSPSPTVAGDADKARALADTSAAL
jgi:membrane protein DedA with SNARE-associated domain